MNTLIFLIGSSAPPHTLKNERGLSFKIIENAYSLKVHTHALSRNSLLIVYLDFVEQRHLDFYNLIKKAHPELPILFVVNEISEIMMFKIQLSNDFIVIWKNEEQRLIETIQLCTDGYRFQNRQDKRLIHDGKVLLRLINLQEIPVEKHAELKNFESVQSAHLLNISNQGSCLQIRQQFYKPKDFINISYQNQEGTFISTQGQIRWVHSEKKLLTQKIGLHLVSSYQN
jgi:hypothetical protein